jgi:hypothetical protein
MVTGWLPSLNGRSQMEPKSRTWQELTWSWAFSTGSQAPDQRLAVAAEAAWPYALLCAWSYLNDRDAAHDLMDYAIQKTAEYGERHADFPVKKLTWHMKSSLKRCAQKQAARRRFEVLYGSLADLEKLRMGGPSADQQVYAKELFDSLSPFAQSIANWRVIGYSWREIASELEMDHTVVRRAYFREVDSVIDNLSRSGDPCK